MTIIPLKQFFQSGHLYQSFLSVLEVSLYIDQKQIPNSEREKNTFINLFPLTYERKLSILSYCMYMCTCDTSVNRWSRCWAVNLEAAAARIEWTFSTWTGFSLTCISQIDDSSSRDSRTPRNSTIDRSLSQYWAWCRFPEREREREGVRREWGREGSSTHLVEQLKVLSSLQAIQQSSLQWVDSLPPWLLKMAHQSASQPILPHTIHMIQYNTDWLYEYLFEGIHFGIKMRYIKHSMSCVQT